MVNTENPDYEMCVQNKYLVRDSRGIVRPIEWWHGSGGLLDYTNPDAVAWWHSKMDQVLDLHVDGFKCDGTDPYILEYSLTGGALGYNDQVISYRDYANMYYRDFFYYTRTKNKAVVKGVTIDDAGLIMSRPVDCLLDEVSKGCTPFSPKDVMYSGWVGDDDGSFEGLRSCMRKIIYSAWTGYGNFGCDVAGYRYDDDLKDKTYFLRSAQLNSFLPLMENGGGGEHRPWMYDDETVAIYRKFVNEHYRLSAYLLTTGANAVDSKVSSVLPVDEHTFNMNITDRDGRIVYPQPTTYSYRLGEDVLVHPLMYNGKNETKTDAGWVEMRFPAVNGNADTLWLDWWRPDDLSKAFKAGEKKLQLVPLSSYSVYVRAGALLPLHDFSYPLATDEKTEVKVNDGQVDMDAIIFTWFQPFLSALYTESSPLTYSLRESVSTGRGMQAKVFFDGAERKTITAQISSRKGPAGFALVGIKEPQSVDIKSWPTARCREFYVKHMETLRVHCADASGGIITTISGYEQ